MIRCLALCQRCVKHALVQGDVLDRVRVGLHEQPDEFFHPPSHAAVLGSILCRAVVAKPWRALCAVIRLMPAALITASHLLCMSHRLR